MSVSKGVSVKVYKDGVELDNVISAERNINNGYSALVPFVPEKHSITQEVREQINDSSEPCGLITITIEDVVIIYTEED